MASVAAVQVTVPAAPTGGVLQVKVDVLAVSETKVVPAGRASVMVTFCASDGPPLNTKIE